MVECQRCGHQQHEPRASRYPEDIFLETWHELMDLQHEHKQLLARYKRLEWKLEDARSETDWWAAQALWNTEMWLKSDEPKKLAESQPETAENPSA
jgi:hypothetical protein